MLQKKLVERKFLKRDFYREIITFLIIGAVNTILSICIMFSLYNLYQLGYWFSSFSAYLITAVIGFILNRKYTFKSTASLMSSAIKFFLTIIICYLIAYSIAKPFVSMILGNIDGSYLIEINDQIAMIVGQIIFTGLNFIGQKFFAFNN